MGESKQAGKQGVMLLTCVRCIPQSFQTKSSHPEEEKNTILLFLKKKKHLKLFCKKACFDNGVNTVTRNLLIGHPVNKEFMKIVSLVFV